MKPETFTARVAQVVARAELPPVSMDTDQYRVYIRFQCQPNAATRQLLRNRGFSYRGGKAQHWVRRNNEAGRAAARLVIATLTERTKEDNQ